MAYKINGTTVVDNSRNVCACCVTSCCITASSRMDVPSGTTAQRPGSPATGSIYFDTDEGSLVSYNGTDWAKVGGGGDFTSNDAVSNTCDVFTVGYVRVCGDRCRGFCSGCNAYEPCQANIGNCWHCTHPLVRTTWVGNCFCTLCFAATLSKTTSRIPGSIVNGAPCCIRTCDHNYRAYDTCNTYGWTQFPDGAICFTLYNCCQCFCFVGGEYKPTFITSKGAVNHYTDVLNFGGVCCMCCINIPPKNLPIPYFKGPGKSGGILYTPCPYFCKFYDSSCHTPGTFTVSYLYEVESQYLGKPKYKVCCTAFNSSVGAVHPRMFKFDISNHRISWICDRYITGSIQCGACFGCFARYDFIVKDNTASRFNPACYCKIQGCNTTFDVKSKTAPNFLYNAIAFGRNPCANGQGRPMFLCCFHAWNSAFLSGDGCYLYMLYSGATCAQCYCQVQFCCHACCPSCTQFHYSSTNGYPPAVDKLDLCTGCIVCSLYYCDLCDCTQGSTTYLRCACASPDLCAIWHCFFGADCRITERAAEQTAGWNQHMSGVGLEPGRCYMRSCNCSAWVYIKKPGCFGCHSHTVIFNECDMNFKLMATKNTHNYNNNCLRHMQFLEMAIRGCCSTIACFSGLCAEVKCWLCCTCNCWRDGFTQAVFSQNLVGHCMMPSPYCFNCCAPLLGAICLLTGVGCICNSGRLCMDYDYFNPYTDHIVCFMALAQDCGTSRLINWIGAVCFDVANGMCISKVETMWPTSGDKCNYALRTGLCVYCACGGLCWTDPTNYDCRPGGFGIQNAVTQGQCSRPKLYVSYYLNEDHSEGGVVVQLPQDSLTNYIENCVVSSCAYCNSCPCSPCAPGYCGYYGPFCKGSCVPCNTCNNCGLGLNGARMSYLATKIPYCKPLSCSHLFEQDDAVKLWFEIAFACHCIGIKACACFCNKTYACAEECACGQRLGWNLPPFKTKVDMTCAFTCNCTNIGPWRSDGFWCVRCMWEVFDTSTACYYITQMNPTSMWWQCNCPGCTFCNISCCKSYSGCTLQQFMELDYSCCIAYYEHCGCDWGCCARCLCWRRCNWSCFYPSIIDNITDTAFAGDTNHNTQTGMPELSFTSHPHNTVEYISGTGYTCTLPSSNGPYGIIKTDANTAKGIAGPLIQWFNTSYALVC